MTERPRVLYILGAGHCGSTLLGMLLNGHPACLAVSELSKLADAIAGDDAVLASPPWTRAAACYERRTGNRFASLELGHPGLPRLARLRQEEIAAWGRKRAALVRCLLEATGRRWIVDGSKSWQPLYLMGRSGQFDLRVIHLIRDARGVVHSYARKYGGLQHGLSKWMKPNLAALVLASQFEQRWLRVHYEELARSPATTLKRICELLGIDYDPAMLRFRQHEWLGIGGNRMSKRTDETIRLDERWRTEMSFRQRLVVEMIGGVINRYYGY